MEKFQELILSAQAVPPTGIVRDDFPAELRGKELPLNMVRGAYFAGTYREIVETLELGTDPFRPPGVPNEAGYHKILDAFEAIKWLKVKSTDRTSLGPMTDRRRNFNVTKLNGSHGETRIGAG